MLSVTRSPLTSPALRTMASASSYIVTPSSPLSYPSSSSLPHTRLPPSMGIPREPYPNTPGKPVYGSYFNFVGASTTPSRFNGTCSPACGSLTPVPVSPSFSSILLSRGSSSNAVKQLGLGRLSMNVPTSQVTSDENSSTNTESVHAQARRKATFKLALPRPTLSRDYSFKSFIDAGAMCSLGTPGTPGTPYGLTWSDSFDSVMTLKPSKGRVPTPYPKMDDGEWIQDVEEAIANM